MHYKLKMKLQIFFLILFLSLSLVSALNYSQGEYGSGLYGIGNYSLIDLDNDNVSDAIDTLLYNTSDIITSGITELNITIAGEPIQSTYNGTKEILFYDGASLILNFTHEFNSSNTIDLSKVQIQKASTYLIVNFSGQLTENKTLYFDDANFGELCVKDAEISSITEITSDCNGANETNLNSCLGNNAGITINGITCSDEGSRIKIENLQHSGVRGVVSTSIATSTTSGGRAQPRTECSLNKDCKESQYCFNSKCYNAECKDNSVCNTEQGETCFDYRCVKLFDMVILEFESPIKLGEFFEFTYLIKGMANISGDVEINFWIENENGTVTSGKDTIYLGSFEEKTKSSKLFLPSSVQSGTYTFRVEVSYGLYTAKSHRTVEIVVNEDGTATLVSLPENNSNKQIISIFLYILSGLIMLGIIALGIIFYLKKRKKKGHKINRRIQGKKHKKIKKKHSKKKKKSKK